jgi:hypothetical protein
MTLFLRTLVVATALLTSGAPRLAAALGEDACCTDEQGVPCPECPPGVACACCPIRGALQASTPEVAPARSRGIAIAVAAAEPSLVASGTDIFHPPRG